MKHTEIVSYKIISFFFKKNFRLMSGKNLLVSISMGEFTPPSPSNVVPSPMELQLLVRSYISVCLCGQIRRNQSSLKRECIAFGFKTHNHVFHEHAFYNKIFIFLNTKMSLFSLFNTIFKKQSSTELIHYKLIKLIELLYLFIYLNLYFSFNNTKARHW